MQIKLKFSKAKLIFLGVGIFVLSFGVIYLVLNWNNVVAQVSGGLKSVIDYFDSRNPGGNPEYYIAQKTNLKVEGGQVKLSLPPEPYLVIYISTGLLPGGNFGGRPGLDNFCLQYKPSNLPSNCANCHAFISVNENDEIRDMPENYGYNRNWNIYWWNRTQGKLYMAFSKWGDMPLGWVTSPETGLGRFTSYFSHVLTGTNGLTLGVKQGYTCGGWQITGTNSMASLGCIDYRYSMCKGSGWIDNNVWQYCGFGEPAIYCICACGL